MGPGQKSLNRVGSGQFFVTHVGSGQPSMVLVRKITPKSLKFIIYLKKISFGRVKKYPDQMRVGLLFAVGQKKARVGSGPISSQYRL